VTIFERISDGLQTISKGDIIRLSTKPAVLGRVSSSTMKAGTFSRLFFHCLCLTSRYGFSASGGAVCCIHHGHCTAVVSLGHLLLLLLLLHSVACRLGGALQRTADRAS
jgi:hypothetical protein